MASRVAKLLSTCAGSVRSSAFKEAQNQRLSSQILVSVLY